MNHYRIKLLASLAVLATPALTSGPVSAQTPAPPPIYVIVPEDYPAFQPPEKQPDPRAREVRALVTRSPTGGDTLEILINPEHLNAGTLRDAILMLNRSLARQPQDQSRFVLAALAVPEQVRPIDPRVAGALDATVEELRGQPVRPVDRVGNGGRRIVLTDIAPFLPRPD